jgi:Zn finger protein HypA/HybF involved in hydrogenase expression
MLKLVEASSAAPTRWVAQLQVGLAGTGRPSPSEGDEGAALHVSVAPIRYWCVECLFEFSSLAPGGGACPRCGRAVLSLDSGAAARVVSIGLAAR